MTMIWPRSLAPRSISWTPATPQVRGPRTIGGVQRRVTGDAGHWRARLVDIPLHGDKVLLWRALVARLLTTDDAVLVPVYDTVRNPLEMAGLADPGAEVPFEDDSFFSDDTGWLEASGVCNTKASAAIRATSIRCQVELGVTLQAGQYLTWSEHLHVISSVSVSASDTRDQTLGLWPPLRAAITGTQPIEVVNPVCRMRFADDPPEALLQMPQARHGFVTVELEEVV